MVQVEVEAVSQRGFPHRGDVWEVDLEPVVGSETGKRRPALVISRDENNQFSDTVTVLPITGQPARKQYPFEVSVPKGIAGLTRDSRIKANQIRTIDKRRLVAIRGSFSHNYLAEVEKALKVHLNLA